MDYRTDYMKRAMKRLMEHDRFVSQDITKEIAMFALVNNANTSGNVPNLVTYKAALMEMLYAELIDKLGLRRELGELVICLVRFLPHSLCRLESWS